VVVCVTELGTFALDLEADLGVWSALGV
jgi:hypothetical protein